MDLPAPPLPQNPHWMIYATREAKIYTTKLLIMFNVGAFGLIALCTFLFSKGHQRVTIVGWICAVFSVSVFAAPLSIMRLVIKTKSVEYMPFAFSFFLTLCAIIWFLYGFFIKDYYNEIPNILGFAFGIAQMALYIVYKYAKKQISPQVKPQDLGTVINLVMLI
ncbi:bidirectional sugar transporter SWEET14-like [Camellia sinensis]|uniref:bidirectional sugar transporter SWEET14-like n=1 Tax=Camellia sinensis TaxID=4442 RepID=UPI001035FBF8|nr:bidirectional sugar transporter SWEET14-like [Camellia sinensis]